MAYIAIVEGDGIPLWCSQPTMENLRVNVQVGWLPAYEACVVVLDLHNGTSVVAHDGQICFAVTSCLVELTC